MGHERGSLETEQAWPAFMRPVGGGVGRQICVDGSNPHPREVAPNCFQFKGTKEAIHTSPAPRCLGEGWGWACGSGSCVAGDSLHPFICPHLHPVWPSPFAAPVGGLSGRVLHVPPAPWLCRAKGDRSAHLREGWLEAGESLLPGWARPSSQRLLGVSVRGVWLLSRLPSNWSRPPPSAGFTLVPWEMLPDSGDTEGICGARERAQSSTAGL